MPTRPADGTPTGIQRLVRRAAVEEAFRRRLLAAPAAVAAADPELTPRERAVLAAVPRAQLAAMIDAVRPTAGIDRRAFVRASSSVLLLGGVALTACPTLTCGGIAPDIPPVDAGPRHDAPPADGQPDGNAALVVLTDSLPGAVVGRYYNQQLRTQGGGSAFEFAVDVGVLPDGLKLDGSLGIIYGTPTLAGTFSFTVRVTSDDEQTAGRALSIDVTEPDDAGVDDAAGAADGAATDGPPDA
jgi:hypothetical protein